MSARESFAVAVATLRGNAMRSALSVLGIVMGTAAVISVISVLEGFQRSLTLEMEQLGASYVVIVPYQPVADPGAAPVPARLTWEEGEALARRLPNIRRISPAVAAQVVVAAGDRRHTVSVAGVGEVWQELRKHTVEYGRFFSRLEREQRRKVAVIGTRVAEELRLGRPVVGQEILIAGQPFTVIGLLEPRGRSLGRDADDIVLIPFESALNLLGRSFGELIEIHIQAGSAAAARSLKDGATPLLRKLHGLRPRQPDDFRIFVQDEVLASVTGVMSSAKAVVAGIVGISLLVAGVGIMNIMLVSVTERTREIGLRKSVGARRKDILHQFLVEAVLLTFSGGILGTAIGYGCGALLTRFLPASLPSAHVPLGMVALTVGICGLIGLFFGIVPAGRAAGLDPIVALHSE